jgi:hypothetical protein
MRTCSTLHNCPFKKDGYTTCSKYAYTEGVGKKESEIAAYLAKKRWDAASEDERKAVGEKLAKARWEGTTREERSAAASAAAKARWANTKKTTAKKTEKKAKPK